MACCDAGLSLAYTEATLSHRAAAEAQRPSLRSQKVFRRCLVLVTTARLLPRRELPWHAADVFVAYQRAGWELRTAAPPSFQHWRNVDPVPCRPRPVAILPNAGFAMSAEQRLALAHFELLRQELRLELAESGQDVTLADEPSRRRALQEEALIRTRGVPPLPAELLAYFARIDKCVEASLARSADPVLRPGIAWL